jgi:intracellular septation protein A
MPDQRESRAVSPWSLMLGTGPRFARDAFGPVVVFYLGWKLVDLRTGILAATVLAVIAYLWERRRDRSGVTAAIGLCIALVQAAAGLATGSTTGYFAPGLIVNGAYGLAFLGSVLIGRPLAGVFARETYPFSPEMVASLTFRRVFSQISLVWATYLLLRTGIRMIALLRTSVELFLVINVLTGIPLTVGIMAWSIWYGHRRFSTSQEWRPAAQASGSAPP